MEEKKKETTITETLRAGANAGAKLKKVKWTLIGAAIVALVACVAVFFVWNEGNKRGQAYAEEQIEQLKEELAEERQRNQELIDNPVVVNPIAPEVKLDVVNAEIKELGELATMEYLYTNAGIFEKARKAFDKFDIPGTRKTFTMKWDGVIKAGIDINQVTTEADEESKILTIHLPEAKILSHDPDKDSVEIYNERDGIFNKVTVEDQVAFDAACEKEMEERAIQNGLLEKAEENAEEVISRLLNANPIIAEHYTIEFTHQK